MNTPPALFFFDNEVVGAFASDIFPESDGEFQYEPFRGPGHFALQQKLKRETAECFYKDGTVKITFEVIDCPRYGTLTAKHFQSDTNAA